jgi:cytoskeleton protein RodZ
MQVSSDSLGSYLRAEREHRGISLQEISAVTKIQVKFLDALEEDAYERLPPTPFVIGFLRAYAQCLSLVPDDIVMAYHQRHRVSATVEQPHSPRTPQRRQTTHLGTVGVGVGVVVLGLFAVLVLRGLRAGDEVRQAASTTVVTHEQAAATGTVALTPAPAVSPTPPADLRVPPAAPVQAPPAVPQAAAPPSEAPAALPKPLPQTILPVPQVPVTAPETTVEATLPPLVLQADAVEDTWLRVIIDDHQRYALLLKAGQNIRWQAEERFVLTVGNVRGTRLQLNEQAVSLPPTGSNVVRDFVLTREVLN